MDMDSIIAILREEIRGLDSRLMQRVGAIEEGMQVIANTATQASQQSQEALALFRGATMTVGIPVGTQPSPPAPPPAEPMQMADPLAAPQPGQPATRIVVQTLPKPDLMLSAPIHDGRRPGYEKVTAQSLLSFMEVYRDSTPGVGDQELILLTAGQFKTGGRSHSWWHQRVQTLAREPIVNWESFKAEFLTAMKGPNEAVQLMLRLKGAAMEGNDLYGYIHDIQNIIGQLNANPNPAYHVGEGLAVFFFALGLPKHLRERIELGNPSLNAAISKVTDKANNGQLQTMLGEHARGPKPGYRRLNVIEVDDEEEDVQPISSGEWGEEDEQVEELYAMGQQRNQGSRGRGNRRGGRGGFRRRRGRGASATAAATGTAAEGGKEEGDVIKGRLRNNECLLCGSNEHWARDCHLRAKKKENSKG